MVIHLAAEKAALAKIPKEPASFIKFTKITPTQTWFFLPPIAPKKLQRTDDWVNQFRGANSVEGTYKVKLNLRGSGYSSSRMIGEVKLTFTQTNQKNSYSNTIRIDRKGNSTNVFMSATSSTLLKTFLRSIKEHKHRNHSNRQKKQRTGCRHYWFQV